ncbi:MAG: DUF1294 domain-containing protein [Clostridia bacterium]|nr:DUF1294 domain-containing protein [Clostridia bacterium]
MKVYWYILAVCSLISMLLMGIDKARAIAGKRRISEKALFLSALIMGGCGGFLGMVLFRHKTKHWYFVVCFSLLAALQAGVGLYLTLGA